MTDLQNQAPTRLLDDPSLGAALRGDLELASAQPSFAYDTAAGLARFEKTLASPSAAAWPINGLRVIAWLLGASVIISGAIGAASVLSQPQPERVSSYVAPRIDIEPEDNSVAGPSSSAPRVPVAEATADDPSGQAMGGTPALDDVPTPPRPVAKSSDDTPTPEPSLADEAQQINEARKALDRDPSRTLALVEDAEQRFPNGAMIQERRGYAILALVALGRMAEAERRADAYLERWPNGTLARRVRDTLGR